MVIKPSAKNTVRINNYIIISGGLLNNYKTMNFLSLYHKEDTFIYALYLFLDIMPFLSSGVNLINSIL